MAYLDEVAAIIDANTTAAGTGSDFPIFRSHLPDSTVLGDRAVALIHTEGFGDMARVEVGGPGLQVVTRGRSILQTSTAYEEAYAVAEAVRSSLHEYTGTSASSSGNHYVGIWSENGPFFAGFDETMRPLFSNNFRVQRSRT